MVSIRVKVGETGFEHPSKYLKNEGFDQNFLLKLDFWGVNFLFSFFS